MKTRSIGDRMACLDNLNPLTLGALSPRRDGQPIERPVPKLFEGLRHLNRRFSGAHDDRPSAASKAGSP